MLSKTVFNGLIKVQELGRVVVGPLLFRTLISPASFWKKFYFRSELN